jgi:GT2 family glycosyltransferase
MNSHKPVTVGAEAVFNCNASEASTSVPAEQVDCAIVVVTYNSARDVAALLQSLPAAADGLTTRVVVVDNGSSDSTVSTVKAWPDIVCIETGANLGYAGGINVGRQYFGEYSALLIVNPDAVLAPCALRTLFTALRDRAKVGIVAPTLVGPDGHRLPSLRRRPSLMRTLGDAVLGGRLPRRPGWLTEMVWDQDSYEYRHPADWATGAVLLISSDCDKVIGPWDERFFLYSEETDYAARAWEAGFRVEYVPEAHAMHRGAGSGRSDYLVALLAINRIRYAEKHGHWPWAYRLAVIVAELLRHGKPGHSRALPILLRRSRWSELTSHLQQPSSEQAAPSSP